MRNLNVVSLIPLLFIGMGWVLRHQERLRIFRHCLEALVHSDGVQEKHRRKRIGKIPFQLALSFFITGIVLIIAMLLGKTVSTLLILGIVTLSMALLCFEQLQKRKIIKYKRTVEYLLPLIVERIIMAVEAGLDVIPALKAVIDLEKRYQGFLTKNHIARCEDPLCEALNHVIERTERGQNFEESLKEVARNYDSANLHNAFLHLGIAQKEGGDLIGPLRELGDATQRLYQDTIEEELAKLPVKATGPLILTFAGLILFFLATPLVQILSFASKAVPK